MRCSITALVFMFVLSPDASACSCAPITLKNSVKNADSVYIATLHEAKVVPGGSKSWTSIEGRFIVHKTLKGIPSDGLVILHTPRDSGACGVEMTVAARYVIFKGSVSDGIIACDGSGVLGDFGPGSLWDEDEVTAEVQKTAQESQRQR